MTRNQAIEQLIQLDNALHALNHAMGLLTLDGVTAAPKKSAAGRGETIGYLSELYFHTLTAPENAEILQTVLEAKDEVPAVRFRQAEEIKKEYDEIALMPPEEYVSWQKLLNESSDVWHEAKLKSDFSLFEPYLDKMIAYSCRVAELKDSTRPAYDVLLDSFEKGLTREKLDPFFALLRSELTPLIHAIGERPQPDTSFVQGTFALERQRAFADRLVALMGIDRARCSLAETEHPFMEGFNRDDIRVCTHYHEDDVLSNLFSVIHEGGHALYELGISPELSGTRLSTGCSMALHESQSRFYENIIGRSEAFCHVLLPLMQEIFPQQMAGVTVPQLYRAVNVVQPSLIRTEADELTYPMHVMIRYELEKRMIAGELKAADVPAEWNRMYQEYLGVDVPDDRRGCLQDSHWSSGLMGYFPTYALGSAYGAQMLDSMKQTFDPFAGVAMGDIGPVSAWLGEHVHQYGLLLYPEGVLQKACGAPFDPKYYIAYLKNKYTALYGL